VTSKDAWNPGDSTDEQPGKRKRGCDATARHNERFHFSDRWNRPHRDGQSDQYDPLHHEGSVRAPSQLRAHGQPTTEMSLSCTQQPDRSEHSQHALEGSEDQGGPVPASKELLKEAELCRSEPEGHHGGGGNQGDEAALPAESIRNTDQPPLSGGGDAEAEYRYAGWPLPQVEIGEALTGKRKDESYQKRRRSHHPRDQ
jgi:hypothetical protein